MAIGLTVKQRADLTAMLPNIDESVASLKRLISDAKDRTRALQKLDEAETAQKRHANDVGIPFNAEAFARRRAELNALPQQLTVEEGQLASFSALQRAIGVIADGPYVREGRGGAGARKGAARGRGAKSPPSRNGKAKKVAKKSGAKKAAPRKASPVKSPVKSPAKSVTKSPVKTAARTNTGPAPKPLPLSLGS
jgi:hypothetical protein